VADLLISETQERYTGYGLFLDRCCKVMAVLAGVVLTAMAFMSLWSIGGRALLDKSLVGDFELVQIMTAAAVALALPYANWIGGHVIVDFFTAKAPVKTNASLDAIAYGLMALFSFVLAWRLLLGMLDLRTNMDASMLLSIPTWWGYLPLIPGFIFLGLTSLYKLQVNLRKVAA
jgi:TRAP-type C4-dicarboxylate transport system permease small subunit